MNPARLRGPPQSTPATPLPARCRPTETATRACRSCAAPRTKTASGQWPDQRVSPGRITRTGFSARTPLGGQPRHGTDGHPAQTSPSTCGGPRMYPALTFRGPAPCCRSAPLRKAAHGSRWPQHQLNRASRRATSSSSRGRVLAPHRHHGGPRLPPEPPKTRPERPDQRVPASRLTSGKRSSQTKILFPSGTACTTRPGPC